jgi:hypothetical protein
MCDLDHSQAGGGTMKRQAVSLVSLLGLLLVAESAMAQTVHVRADVPFNFSVGSKTYPAGAYSVKTISDRDVKVLLLHAEDGKNSMPIISNATENLTPADKTKLVFSRYGNQYFLSQVWLNGATRGHQLPKSNREKEVAKTMARNLATEQVEVVASIQ